jgi:hypothetical protein
MDFQHSVMVPIPASDVIFCRVTSSGEAIEPWVHSGRIEAITSNILRSPSLFVYLGCVVCVTDKHSDMFRSDDSRGMMTVRDLMTVRE